MENPPKVITGRQLRSYVYKKGLMTHNILNQLHSLLASTNIIAMEQRGPLYVGFHRDFDRALKDNNTVSISGVLLDPSFKNCECVAPLREFIALVSS